MVKLREFLILSGGMIFFFLLAFPQLDAGSGIEPYKFERVGLSGWQFLKMNGSARQMGMGETYAATSHGDAGAIWGNPSALVDVDNFDVLGGHIEWIADIDYNCSAIVRNFGSFGTIGLSIASINLGEMMETVNEPIPGENRTRVVVTGKTFTAGDFATGLSYARRVTDLLSLGGNIRWIQERIENVSMWNVSFDLGATYYTGFKSLRVGMVMRNGGPDTHLVGWSQEYEAEAVDIKMPVEFRVGTAMDFFESEKTPHFLTLSLEGIHPNDGPEKIHVGAEYYLNGILALRGGYKIDLSTSEEYHYEQSYTFGASLAYPVGNFGIRFNYAYVDFGRLLQSNLFTLGLSF